MRQLTKEQKQQRAAYNKAYRAAHRERLQEHDRVNYAMNREKRQEVQKTYRRIHAEKICQRKKELYEEQKEERAAKNRAYRLAHREELLQKQRDRHVRNRARDLARMSDYWLTHREERNAYIRRWSQANPEKVSSRHARRRARKQAALLNDLTDAQWQKIKEHYGHRCVYCQRKMTSLTRDHITPLVKGGAHTYTNIVPACQSCNSRKHDRGPFIPVQPLLLVP